jgi:Arc/MetJ-type ribon-helix-helix transcriptional regulator
MAKRTKLEFRTTVRFPEKDWKFLEELISKGEFCCESDAIRAAVREFREKHQKKGKMKSSGY